MDRGRRTGGLKRTSKTRHLLADAAASSKLEDRVDLALQGLWPLNLFEVATE